MLCPLSLTGCYCSVGPVRPRGSLTLSFAYRYPTRANLPPWPLPFMHIKAKDTTCSKVLLCHVRYFSRTLFHSPHTDVMIRRFGFIIRWCKFKARDFSVHSGVSTSYMLCMYHEEDERNHRPCDVAGLLRSSGSWTPGICYDHKYNEILSSTIVFSIPTSNILVRYRLRLHYSIPSTRFLGSLQGRVPIS